MQPTWKNDHAELYLGDCTEVMPTLMPRSVDLVLTDPPYMISTQSTSSRTMLIDVKNAAVFYERIFRECCRLLKPTGHLAVFGNSRSWLAYWFAAAKLDITVSNPLIWDRVVIGAGPRHAFRQSYETIAMFPMVDAEIPNRSARDVFTHPTVPTASRVHPAQKPVEVCEYVVQHCSPQRGVVADWFCGSGTTAVAAIQQGRRFIGAEENRDHFAVAKRRVEMARPPREES